MNKLLIFILASLFLSFTINTEGKAMERNLNIKERINEQFNRIDFTKEITKDEAIVIAQKLLLDKGNDEFLIITKIRKIEGEKHPYGKEYWWISFSTTFKVKISQGLKWGIVLVNKKTGKAEYIGEGPS